MNKSKTSKMTGEQRRKQIKSVALELFARKKYHSTTMAKVASAAGVSEPLVYQHFKNKKELFLSVLSECYENIIRETKQVLASKGDIKRALLVLVEMTGDIDEVFNQSIDLLFYQVNS